MNNIYREANAAADFLATYSLAFPVGLHYLQSPPLNLLNILNNDVSGVAHSRLVLP